VAEIDERSTSAGEGEGFGQCLRITPNNAAPTQSGATGLVSKIEQMEARRSMTVKAPRPLGKTVTRLEVSPYSARHGQAGGRVWETAS
jgi:hypothetical protein